MYFFIDQKCYSLISQIGTAQKGHLLYTILTLTLYHFDTYSIPLYHFDTYSIPFWHLLYTILTPTLYHFDTYSIPFWYLLYTILTLTLYHFDTYSIPFLTLPKDFSHKLKLKKKLDYPWWREQPEETWRPNISDTFKQNFIQIEMYKDLFIRGYLNNFKKRKDLSLHMQMKFCSGCYFTIK